MDQAQKKPEEATTKLIRLNQEKRITHFGKCFLQVHSDDKQLILKAPDSSQLFASNFDPIIFFQRHNFLFAVDTITFNDYVLVCQTADVCTFVMDAIKRYKTMEATNDMMEEFFFKHHFYIPIFNEVKAGIAGENEIKDDLLGLVILHNPQKRQEYMNLALKILDVPHIIPPAYEHQFIQHQVHNDLTAQVGDPAENSNSSVHCASHLSDTSSLVDDMNSEAVPGSSTGHSSHKRSSRNVSCEEFQAISTAHQHQSLRDQASRHPKDNSSSFDGTVLHDPRLSDTSSLVDGMNSEAVPGSSTGHSSRKSKLQIVSDMDIEAYFNDDGEDTPSRSFVPGKTVERSSRKRSSQNFNCRSIPSAHPDQSPQDQMNNDIQLEDPTDNSYSFDNTDFNASRFSDTSSFVDGLNVTSDTFRRSSNERSSRKRKLHNISYEEMGYSDEGEEESLIRSNRKRRKARNSRLMVADEARIVKLPHYKLYQEQRGENMSKRLVIFGSSNPSLGYKYGYAKNEEWFYCLKCRSEFNVMVFAELVENENGNYIQNGTRDHQCTPKEFRQ